MDVSELPGQLQAGWSGQQHRRPLFDRLIQAFDAAVEEGDGVTAVILLGLAESFVEDPTVATEREQYMTALVAAYERLWTWRRSQ